jgi:ABC-type multidrug transport system permease subunit
MLDFLAVSLLKDWARTRRDPFQFVVALGIPLVLAVLMSLVFGHQPASPRGLLLVADEDRSIASGRMVEVFHRDPLSGMLVVENVTRDSGRARIDRGDASAFLLIPAGFQRAFLLNQPVRLELVTNPSQSIVPQMIAESLSIAVDTAFYLRRAYFRPEAGPPLIELQTTLVREPKPAPSFAATFLPSMLFMGLLFIANSTAADIWKERMAGTLRRLASSPVPLAWYLTARVVFVAMLYLLVSLAGLVAAQRLAGLPVPDLPAATLWVAYAGTVFYLLFLWIAVQAGTQRGASVLANLVIFPLAMLGGCFFPFEWMPAWMAAAGRLTPNGRALSEFKAILDGTTVTAHLAASAALLAAVGAAAFLLTLRRLHRSFAV